MLTAEGGVAPYAWSIVEGALCDGLTLTESSGEISGVPILSQTCGFTVRLTDDTDATADKAFDLSVISSSGDFENAGLVARFYFDEAESGTIPEAVIGYGIDGNGVADLEITYGGNCNYVAIGGNRALECNSLGGAQRATHALNDELDPIYLGMGAGSGQKITLCYVARIDAIRESPLHSRFIGIRDVSGDVGNLAIEMDPGSGPGTDQYHLVFNGVIVGDWLIDYVTRNVYCIKIDTTQATPDDRLRVFKDGSEVSVTVRNGGIPHNSAFDVATDQALIVFNWGGNDRSFDGAIFGFDLFGVAKSDSEIIHNTAIWQANDDRPAPVFPRYCCRANQ
jgi:hypothetical protein